MIALTVGLGLGFIIGMLTSYFMSVPRPKNVKITVPVHKSLISMGGMRTRLGVRPTDWTPELFNCFVYGAEISLEDQLKTALDEELYERDAELRDEIKNKTK